jgi:GTPase SAR1 family protein
LESGYSIEDVLTNHEQLLRVRDADDFPAVIALTKRDLDNTGFEVSMESVMQTAKHLNINHVIETSALNGTNITEVFVRAGMSTIDKLFANLEWVEQLESGIPLTDCVSKIDRKRRKKKCNLT